MLDRVVGFVRLCHSGYRKSLRITYLMGGESDGHAAVQNMIANLTGMICDGAKPSCALKLTSGVSTAVFSAILAMEGKCVTSVEGIIEDNVDFSIRNLTKRMGSEGMNQPGRTSVSTS